MIESISLAEDATYGTTPEVMCGLSKFNYIFGSNGTGKTTISRVIDNEGLSTTSKVTWKGGIKLKTMVYNRDFVENNFNQSSEMKGVFTLGENNQDIFDQIQTIKNDCDCIDKDIVSLNSTLEVKRSELKDLDEEIKNKCWDQKIKHDAKLKEAFSGYRSSQVLFMGNILAERDSNTEIVESLSDLEEKAETVFGPTKDKEDPIDTIDTGDLYSYQSKSILNKHVFGKEDIDIAEMIKKLGNSDWVKQGQSYYQVNEGFCPFCQQKTTNAFAQSLNDYFDKTFETDIKSIRDLIVNYKADSENLKKQIEQIITSSSGFLDIEKIKEKKKLLDSKIATNIQRLAAKNKEPSRSITLESISDICSEIITIINEANTKINCHNKTITNLKQEKIDLTAKVWKYLIEVELKTDLSNYKSQSDALAKAIDAISDNIKEKENIRTANIGKIRTLEKQITSIQPTIDSINSIMKSYGFSGFRLAKASTENYYKLVRTDGDDAMNTLSEGEKAFITILYFYHLLKGSNSESGTTADRVVVFDDPVSSLDSDILFVVSSLIKGICEEVREDKGYIKQVFILTHNVYFHKEVTYNPKRNSNTKLNEETFWIIRKIDSVSKIEEHSSNPIKTSYDLLWAEIRNTDYDKLTIQNTMRRILESYFKLLGGVNPDQICGHFEGNDKLICNSLFSWVNAGSHHALDDVNISTTDTVISTYLKVFKVIFDKMGHGPHYKMMMGDAYIEPSAESELV